MSDPKQPEPSMDEILASIRRILSEDDAEEAAKTVPMPSKTTHESATLSASSPPFTATPNLSGIPTSPLPPPPAPSRPPPSAPTPSPSQTKPSMMSSSPVIPKEPTAEVTEKTTPSPQAKRSDFPTNKEDIFEKDSAKPFVLSQARDDILDHFENQDENLLDDDEILDLTDDMVVDEVMDNFKTSRFPDLDEEESFLNYETQESSTLSLAALARAVAQERGMGLGNKGLTLEEIVREILRSLIKDWLDENLPYMIERIVKKEIERMVNRAEDL
jgi:cell pole-organizing protein PopZ